MMLTSKNELPIRAQVFSGMIGESTFHSWQNFSISGHFGNFGHFGHFGRHLGSILAS